MQIDLQYYILEQINSLLESERNQQILCKSGMLTSLLGIYSHVLCDDSHPLNSSVQRIMERLATQTITPRELRYVETQEIASDTYQPLKGLYRY